MANKRADEVRHGKDRMRNQVKSHEIRDQVKIKDTLQPMPGQETSEAEHSFTVGPRGPVLVTDSILQETLENFVHSNVLPRTVHTKGFGAFGHFKLYQSMEAYTKAPFLQRPSQTIPVLVRFSLAVSNPGTPDTFRNIRGFSTKFYTPEGNFDLLCNHIPVFLVRDAINFTEAISSLSPSPVNNLADPERFWSFVACHPEAMHFITWFYSDVGTIASLRHIRAYGVNTYVWRNKDGYRVFIKYHWLPIAGEKNITRQEAQRLAGESPDIAGQDLYNTLAKGQTVKYELNVQIMDPSEACKLSFDPLDDTRTWDESQYPLLPVGLLILERNPDDYRNQVEKVAFSPSNLVNGIELSEDKMLQGRSFIYWDAQRRRLGPDFREIPVNREKDWTPSNLVTSGEGVYSSGIRMRTETPKAENFIQAGERYEALSNTQKDHLVDNIASELHLVSIPVQDKVLEHFRAASPELANRIRTQIKKYD